MALDLRYKKNPITLIGFLYFTNGIDSVIPEISYTKRVYHMSIYNNITELIGQTRLLNSTTSCQKGAADVYAKAWKHSTLVLL